MYKHVASLDSKFLKVRGKFVSSDLPEIRGFLLCSVNLTLSHNDMLVEGTKKWREATGFKWPFLPIQDNAKVYLDVSGRL